MDFLNPDRIADLSEDQLLLLHRLAVKTKHLEKSLTSLHERMLNVDSQDDIEHWVHGVEVNVKPFTDSARAVLELILKMKKAAEE